MTSSRRTTIYETRTKIPAGQTHPRNIEPLLDGVSEIVTIYGFTQNSEIEKKLPGPK